MPETTDSISPITAGQQQQVLNETLRFLDVASDHFLQDFDTIPVLFDLKGKAAGMYRVKMGQRVIRYNPFIFAKYFDDNLQQTIPHEVAHYITDVLFGMRNIRPHGKEWKAVMHVFGVEPNRTASYDLSGVPQRRFDSFIYHCGCQDYALTSRRHNKILRGQGHYLCRDCGGKLKFVRKQEEA